MSAESGVGPAGRILSIVVCGAPPAADVGFLVELAQQRGWTVRVIPTPDAVSFMAVDALEAMTGNKVEIGYRSPADPRPPRPDAVIVAPATFNTVNKAALGITDTHALGVIGEAIGLPVPVVMVPWVSRPLAAREPFRRSVEQLRGEGVHVLLAEGRVYPEPLGAAETDADLPWRQALDIVEDMCRTRR